MKNFLAWAFFVIGIIFLVFSFSPSAKKWRCNFINNRFKGVGDDCSNCETGVDGVKTESGECLPRDVVNYATCVTQNAALNDGAECVGCGSDPKVQSGESFSGKGVTVEGKCMSLPDAFAGRICVPASASVKASPLSYKRVLLNGGEYAYYKNNGNVVSQREGALDEQITKDEYVQAYVQTIKSCPVGQVKV